MPPIHWTTTNVFDAVGADGFIYRIEETAYWARQRGIPADVRFKRCWQTDGELVALVDEARGEYRIPSTGVVLRRRLRTIT
jgi:hypothetical protein